MKLFQLFRCAFGKHERSRSRAYEDGAVMHSVCKGCGRAMIKEHGGWRSKSG